MGRSLFFLYALSLVACAPATSQQTLKASVLGPYTCQPQDVSARVLYGADNRKDWHEAPRTVVQYWARATLAIMPQRSLVRDSEEAFLVHGPSYQRAANLCPGHRFAQQTTAAFCSGFLVAEDLVVTAGHCVRNQVECQGFRFVFDYALPSAGESQARVPQSSVYQCAEIVERKVGLDDFALIRLDRPVLDREPLAVRREGRAEVGEPVLMVGHPMGLPSKVADGGQIVQTGERLYASVDAFLGNSGSPIINLRTGRVEGLLVAGEPDFVDEAGCRRERVCEGSCRGEGLTPITKLSHLLAGLSDQPRLACSFDR